MNVVLWKGTCNRGLTDDLMLTTMILRIQLAILKNGRLVMKPCLLFVLHMNR